MWKACVRRHHRASWSPHLFLSSLLAGGAISLRKPTRSDCRFFARSERNGMALVCYPVNELPLSMARLAGFTELDV